MNLIIKIILLLFISYTSTAMSEPLEIILKEYAIANGFSKSEDIYINPDENLHSIGEKIFASEGLSINGNMSCQTCHLDKHGSADGLPVAAAVGGMGEGIERFRSGAKLLPRNTLPFWGRGAKDFNVFFWGGKVDISSGVLVSQFGSSKPSNDPLIVAVHLPVVEIREMLEEDELIDSLKQESLDTVDKAYELIVDSLKSKEPIASKKLAATLNIPYEDLSFFEYARSIASFIRFKFKIKVTKFEDFVFNNKKLSSDELKGGLMFYGKGKCITCHSGPHFSDFKFHNIIFPQLGFGKNGFGVDYGRYNITFNPDDIYKFRTPPLFNVEKTHPYGHDGSIYTLEDSIIAHYDPLSLIDLNEMDSKARHFLYQRISQSSYSNVGFLNDKEVKQIAKFLKTLSF